jgi:hypothetical protein
MTYRGDSLCAVVQRLLDCRHVLTCRFTLRLNFLHFQLEQISGLCSYSLPEKDPDHISKSYCKLLLINILAIVEMNYMFKLLRNSLGNALPVKGYSLG